ncbi:MAG: glycosyltransferase [Candidatus Omnitrophota bacterium]
MSRDAANLFEKNLIALDSIYPSLAKLLREYPSADEPEIAPPSEAAEEWNPDADIHIVYRFSHSPLARRLFDRLNLEELRRERNRRLLLIEDRLILFRDDLMKEDWRPLVLADHCLFLVHHSFQDGLRRFLAQYPDIAWGTIQFHTGADRPEEAIRFIQSLFKSARNALSQNIEHFINLQNKKTMPPYPQNIRFFVPGHNYLQDAAIRALRRLGYGSDRLAWKNPLYRFTRATAWMKDMQEQEIDAAIFLNSTPAIFTRDSALQRLPIHRAAWFVDNPRRYVSDPSDLEGCDAIGVFDRTYIPYLRARTQAPILEVRTGYGIEFNDPIPQDSSIDIAFVGELGANGFLPLERGFLRLDPNIVTTTNTFLKQIDITQPIDLSPLAEKIFAEKGVEYRGALVDYLENKAAALRRRYFLEALADQGLAIFGGEDWSNAEFAGPLTACFAGKRLNYTSELPRLYASAKINVNLFHPQCVSAPNPRVYDVLACGGFLLTSWNPGLENEFTAGEDLVVFHTKEELRKLAAYYLAHPAERRRIAENGRRKTLAKCGYDGRMQQLLSALITTIGDSYVYLCR